MTKKTRDEIRRRFNLLVAELLSRWYRIGVLISFFVFILSIGAIGYAFYEVCEFLYGIYKYGLSGLKDFLLLIVSLLSDFLLAFVLVILARGIYNITEKASGDPKKAGLADVNLETIEKNFIGIIILTMFVVVLGLILKPEDPSAILYVGITVSILTIAASVYISLSKFVVSKEKE